MDLYKDHTCYGVVLIAGEEVQMYKVAGTKIDKVYDIIIHRQNRHKCGGQSQNRYLNQRQSQISSYIKKICEMMNSNYIDYDEGKASVEGIVVAGNGEIKDSVIESQFLDKLVKCKIKRVITVSECSITAVLKQCQDIFSECDIQAESKIIDGVYEHLSTSLDTVVYGFDNIKRYIDESLVKKLIVHSECKLEKEYIIKAKNNGCIVIELTLHTERGEEFLSSYGGMIGILFYPIEDNIE